MRQRTYKVLRTTFSFITMLAMVASLTAGSFVPQAVQAQGEDEGGESGSVTGIEITEGGDQVIGVDEESDVLVVTSIDSNGDPVDADKKLDLTFESSSENGEFSGANQTSDNCSGNFSTDYTSHISTNSSNKSFCYKDSTPGTHTITISVDGEDWEAETEITVEEAGDGEVAGVNDIPGDGEYEFPSTNEDNKEKTVPGREGQDAPYVELVESRVGEVELKFLNNTNSLAEFEYRIDGEEVSGDDHPVVIGDVIYPTVSVDGRDEEDEVTETETFEADEKVEVRLALGGERDWDFDWVSFEVQKDSDSNEDETLSVPQLIQPEDGSVMQNVEFTQTWSEVDDAVEYEYRSCNNDPEEESCDLKYEDTYTDTEKTVDAGQPDSVFWWQVRAVDDEGNTSDWSEAWKLVIENTNGGGGSSSGDEDTEDPETEELADGKPGDNSTWNGPITVAGTSTDNEGVSHVNIYIKEAGDGDVYGDGYGDPIKTIYNDDNDSPFVWETTIEPEEGGTYDIKVSAVDTSGNEESSAYAYNVTYNSGDETVPEMSDLTMYVERNGNYEESSVVKPGDNVRIEVDATDDGSGIEDVEFRVQSQDKQYVALTSVDSAVEGDTYRFEYQVPTDGKYINTHNPMNEDDDGHFYWVRATDEEGNYHHGISDDFTFDKTHPEVLVVSPEVDEYVSGDVEFKAELTDNYKLADYRVIVHYKEGGVNDRVYFGDWTPINNPGSENTVTHNWDSTVEENGEYHVRIFARDEAGNTAEHHETEDRHFHVDNTDPEGEIEYNGGDVIDNVRYLKSIEDFSFEGTFSDNMELDRTSYVVWEVDEEFKNRSLYCGNWNENASTNVALSGSSDTINEVVKDCGPAKDWGNGNYEIGHRVHDEAGNSISLNQPTEKFVIDGSKPVVEVLAPEDGLVTNSDFEIEIKGSDEDSGLKQLVINLTKDGSHYASCLNEGVGGEEEYTASCAIDVDDLGNGSYGFKTNVRDRADNLSNTEIQSFEIDIDKPKAIITSPENGSVIPSDIVVEGEASDDETGIDHVKYTVTQIDEIGGSYAGSIENGVAVYDNSEKTFEFPVDELETGFYRLKVQAFDEAGNWKYHYVDVEVDNTEDPTTTIVAPTGIVGAVFTVSGKANADSDVGLNRVYVQLVNRQDNNRYGGTTIHLIGEGESADWSREYNANELGLPDGDYAAHVSVVDRDGNTGSAGWTENFTVDSTAPSGSFIHENPQSGIDTIEVVIEENGSAGLGQQQVVMRNSEGVVVGNFFYNVETEAVRVDEMDDEDVNITYSGDEVAGIIQIEFDTNELENGEYNLRLFTKDQVGNGQSAIYGTSVIDNGEPEALLQTDNSFQITGGYNPQSVGGQNNGEGQVLGIQTTGDQGLSVEDIQKLNAIIESLYVLLGSLDQMSEEDREETSKKISDIVSALTAIIVNN